MAFKGIIGTGSSVSASLKLDNAASGPAFLMMGYGRPGGQPAGDGDTASPGGFAKALLDMDVPGRLEVLVDLSSATDTGSLVVSVDGKVMTRGNLPDKNLPWVYAIRELDAAPPAGGDE